MYRISDIPERNIAAGNFFESDIQCFPDIQSDSEKVFSKKKGPLGIIILQQCMKYYNIMNVHIYFYKTFV